MRHYEAYDINKISKGIGNRIVLDDVPCICGLGQRGIGLWETSDVDTNCANSSGNDISREFFSIDLGTYCRTNKSHQITRGEYLIHLHLSSG